VRGRSLEELERIANERARKLDELYLKLPKNRRKQAEKIYMELGEGRITYEEALRKLRELAGRG
jgi:hypothetical protein